MTDPEGPGPDAMISGGEPCEHCGRNPADGNGIYDGHRVCHPIPAGDGPDCLQRLIVGRERPLGALMGLDRKPSHMNDLRALPGAIRGGGR